MVLVLLTWGCVTGPSPSPLVVTTDASRYTLPTQGSVVVHAVATNRGDRALYVLPFAWGVQTENANGSWEPSPDYSAILGQVPPPLAVPVGGSVSDSAFLGASGNYRMWVLFGADSTNATAQHTVSNTFVVTH